jgi:hypothetical protein
MHSAEIIDKAINKTEATMIESEGRESSFKPSSPSVQPTNITKVSVSLSVVPKNISDTDSTQK